MPTVDELNHRLDKDLLYTYSNALTYAACGQMTRAKDIIEYLRSVEANINKQIDQHHQRVKELTSATDISGS